MFSALLPCETSPLLDHGLPTVTGALTLTWCELASADALCSVLFSLLADWLWSRHHIVISAIAFGGVTGVRVTPNVFTTPAEIDAFTDAVRAALHRGLT